MRFAPALLLLALPAASFARADDAPAYEAACRQWAEVAIPQKDIGKAPATCDSKRLYFGSDGEGQDTDHVAARHCAYAERAASGDGQSPFAGRDTPFGGSGMLMMLYANGEGVSRNLPLAKRFACEYGGAPAEIEGRLHSLETFAGHPPAERYDICTDITSGMMMGFCAGRDADFAAIRRDRRWAALQSTWLPAQREALATLRARAKAYFDNVSREETDMSGTMRGVFATEAFEALDGALLADIARFETGERPSQPASAYARSDAALNAAYKRVLATLAESEARDGFDYGTVRSEGVRITQRSWLPYRDAWVRFATARYPKTPTETWKAWLTEQRTTQLSRITE